MQRTLRRQDKKIKEYQTSIDDERRAAEQYKDQVSKNLNPLIKFLMNNLEKYQEDNYMLIVIVLL